MPPTARTAPDRCERLSLAWIVAVALICRAVALFQPIRYDEAVTWVLFTRRSWWTIVSTYPNPNNHVLFSLLAKATSALSPAEPWALRLPAFVAGAAIVPLTWAVGRRLAGRTTALLGAALAAGSTSLILYSANARGHTIVGVITLLLILYADRLRAGGRWMSWLAFAVLGAIGLYTVPVTVYPLGSISLWIALDALRRAGGDWRAATPVILRLIAAGMGAIALAGLLYAPIIHSSGVASLTSNKLALPLGWRHFARMLPRFSYELVTTWTSPLSPWSAPIVLLLALWGMRRERDARRASLALATAVWCTGLLVLTHRTPFVRFWLSILPLFLLAVARGLARWGAAWPRRMPALSRVDAAWGAAALATVIGLVALTTRAAIVTDDTGAFPPAKAVTALIGGRLRPGDRVLAVIPGNAPLMYYFGVSGLDVGLIDTPDSLTRRRFVVLDRSRGQDLAWAVHVGLLVPRRDRTPVLLGTPDGAEVWFAEPR